MTVRDLPPLRISGLAQAPGRSSSNISISRPELGLDHFEGWTYLQKERMRGPVGAALTFPVGSTTW
jgi:hypothetical protein